MADATRSLKIVVEEERKGDGYNQAANDTDAYARKVSEAVFREFDASHDPRISGIPERIEFGGGRPWFVPLSAIDGATLDSWEQGKAKKPRAGLRPPVPVHVELPLLVALCDGHNALM